MKTLASISLSMLFGLGAFAQDNPPPPFQAKHKSSFELKGDRNPFWPIGWKPAGGSKYGEGMAADIPDSAFVVTSITVEKGARFAIINGKIMQEGQEFGLRMGTSIYQLTVKSIEDGRVIIGHRDQEIVVQLRRK